jgi:formylglycine-generating enzyme required for sulfatase activity
VRGWPLWDGQESIADYVRKTGLPPAQTLDLGNGVKLELALVPAGSFVMGTAEPAPVDETPFRQRRALGWAVLAAGAGVFLVLLAALVLRALRRRPRPSRTWFLALALALEVAAFGGLHVWLAARGLAQAHGDYEAALARYQATADDEVPAHLVVLTAPFYIGAREVTQEQYERVGGVNPSYFKGQGRELPVEQVSWDDAVEFCKKASEVAQAAGLRAQPGGLRYNVRLPTEAEWEYACRAGTRSDYCSGDSLGDLADVGWHNGNSGGTLHPVGRQKPNAWGLYDMHGNVWEWCQDWYKDRYDEGAATDPKGPAQGVYRVSRGGGFGDDPEYARSARRFGRDPATRGVYLGFRVVMAAPGNP